MIPRGVRFKVDIVPGPNGESTIRGYICEIFHGHYEIPDLGPIGANGLAHARDFKAPVAHAETSEGEYQIVYKFLGELSVLTQDHTPFDVVAWRGNYVPYKYNLDDFVPVNSVVRDHIDPSIFTVNWLSFFSLYFSQLSRHTTMLGSHLPVVVPGRGCGGLRDLPSPLRGAARHLPSSLLSSQLHD